MTFRSGFERTLNMQLQCSGVPYSYEDTKIPYILHCIYTPDFRLSNGIIIEAKGRLLPDEKRKHMAVKSQHPDLDIRFVFMDADKKTANSNQTHKAWAERNGFKWADGSIPEEWLHE